MTIVRRVYLSTGETLDFKDEDATVPVKAKKESRGSFFSTFMNMVSPKHAEESEDREGPKLTESDDDSTFVPPDKILHAPTDEEIVPAIEIILENNCEAKSSSIAPSAYSFEAYNASIVSASIKSFDITSISTKGSGIQAAPGIKQDLSGIGFEETTGIAIQASPSRIARGDEPSVPNNKTTSASNGETTRLGVQASPSRIERGDAPSVAATVVSDNDMGFEIEIKPTPNLLPFPEGKEHQSNKCQDASKSFEYATETSYSENIPKHVKVCCHKMKVVPGEYKKEFYRHGNKSQKPKKPGKNVLGLRRNGYGTFDKEAARKANRNFLGFPRPKPTEVLRKSQYKDRQRWESRKCNSTNVSIVQWTRW